MSYFTPCQACWDAPPGVRCPDHTRSFIMNKARNKRIRRQQRRYGTKPPPTPQNRIVDEERPK